MDFSGELAAAQQQLAACHDMSVRRVRVLDALAAAPGERVVEVGCGSGLALREIGIAVGERGSAVGLDVSPDQVDAARRACAGLDQVRVEIGDVRTLPFGDGELDATVAVQVLEYVVDVETAVAELARVTRPGGRFVNVATNWSALFWTGGDTEVTAQVLAAWEHHAPHPDLPVALPLVLDPWFAAVRQVPVTIVNRRFHQNAFCWGAARLMAAYAVGTGRLEPAAADRWLDSLARADADGTHFLSSVPVLTTAVRAG